MRVKLPHLQPWQADVFEDIKASVRDIYVVKARRQCGKSILAITTLLYFSLLNENSIGAVVEPTLNQSRRVYKQMVKAMGGDNSPLIKSANASLLTIDLNNGSEICFKSAEQKEALRGMTIKKSILVIDEAAFITKDIFEILYPVTDACKAPVLMISTPLFQDGEFYTKYIEGIASEVVKSYDWSTYDTSIFLSKEKLEYYRKTISPLKFKSEYLGEFITEGSYVFGEFGKSVGSFSTGIPIYGGIDWANGGENDYSVLTLLDASGNPTAIHYFKDLSPTEQIERFTTLLNIPTLKAVQVELNSIGEVYYDILKKRLRPNLLRGFNTTNDSKRKIIENLISAVQTHKIIVPNEPELIREMQHYNIEKTQKGYTYNGADGVNDDMVMSLAFAYDAYKKNNKSFAISFA